MIIPKAILTYDLIVKSNLSWLGDAISGYQNLVALPEITHFVFQVLHKSIKTWRFNLAHVNGI